MQYKIREWVFKASLFLDLQNDAQKISSSYTVSC